MHCSNCGKNIPFAGNVCPWCHTDKSGDQVITILMFIGGIVGAVIGAAAGQVVGAIVGFFAGAIVMCIIGMRIKAAREAHTGGVPTLPNMAATLGIQPPESFVFPQQEQLSASNVNEANAAFVATHVVPASGLAAWAAPDPNQPPMANLAQGVELRVVETAGDWARVVAENSWEGWVDGRELQDVNTQTAVAAATDGEGYYEVVGVDRASGLDTRWTVHAVSRANAKVKAELQGIIVTEMNRR